MTDAKSPGALLFDVSAGRPATKVGMLGVAAKLERRRIVERTARGRADAKPKGAKFGRKPTLALGQVLIFH